MQPATATHLLHISSAVMQMFAQRSCSAYKAGGVILQDECPQGFLSFFPDLPNTAAIRILKKYIYILAKSF